MSDVEMVTALRARIVEHREAAEAAVAPDAVSPQPQLQAQWESEAVACEAELERHTELKGSGPARCAADGEPYPCPRLRRLGEQLLGTHLHREALYARNPGWRADPVPGVGRRR